MKRKHRRSSLKKSKRSRSSPKRSPKRSRSPKGSRQLKLARKRYRSADKSGTLCRPNTWLTEHRAKQLSPYVLAASYRAASSNIPLFPYEQFKAWVVTTLQSGFNFFNKEVKQGSSFVCVKIGGDRDEIGLYWPFQKTLTDVSHWGPTLRFLPNISGQKWTPFETSVLLEWKRIGRDEGALDKAIELAKEFRGTESTFERNGYQSFFLLYSREKEYENENDTTVASVIHDVATQLPSVYHDDATGYHAFAAPSIVAMLCAYPGKITDALAQAESWPDAMVKAFVQALTAMPIDRELECVFLVQIAAEKFPEHSERLKEVEERMHDAYVRSRAESWNK